MKNILIRKIEKAYTYRFAKPLPTGTLERFVAYGYKNYGEKLLMIEPNFETAKALSNFHFTLASLEFLSKSIRESYDGKTPNFIIRSQRSITRKN